MTHLELLNKLPSPIREQAIENSTADFLNKEANFDLSYTLLLAFEWEGSPQKGKYWEAIHARIEAGDFDTPQDPSVTLPREDWEAIHNLLFTAGDFEKAKGIIKAIQ